MQLSASQTNVASNNDLCRKCDPMMKGKHFLYYFSPVQSKEWCLTCNDYKQNATWSPDHFLTEYAAEANKPF